MEIIINSKTEAGSYGNVTELLLARDLDPKITVVEVNGRIIPRSDYEKPLKEGDAVHVISSVADD